MGPRLVGGPYFLKLMCTKRRYAPGEVYRFFYLEKTVSVLKIVAGIRLLQGRQNFRGWGVTHPHTPLSFVPG